MYFKSFTYIGFAALFMRLGSIAGNMVAEEIEHVAVDHEEFVANTSSIVKDTGWKLPGVFILIPTQDGLFGKDLACKEYTYRSME